VTVQAERDDPPVWMREPPVSPNLPMGSSRPLAPAIDEVEDLLAQCLELPAHDRALAIERACANRPELASELCLRVAALRSMGIELAETRGFPEQLGDFRLIELLGGGGMGVVYLAVQTSLQRDVALKLIRPEHLFFAGARARFRREAEAVARLQHPSIVPIYAVGEEQGIPYFAMELVRGCTLAEALHPLASRAPESLRGSDLHAVVATAAKTDDSVHDGSTFDGTWVETCLHIARQVADALHHAHERGLVHRDVKPSNIALTPDGRALLLDFGLTSMDDGSHVTRSGAAMGTLHYMSPEQLRGSREVDAKSDVYSLGVTLYEMLALQVPWRGENALEMQRLLLDAPDSIRARNRRVEADVETVVLCAIDRDPERRYASAADFARDLGHLLAHRPIAARRPTALLRARRWSQRQPALATALVLGPTLLVGAGIAITTQAVKHAAELDKNLRELRDAHAATQLEEQHARSEADTAQHALDFVVGMFTPEPLAHGAAATNEDPSDTFLHGESAVAEKLAGDPRAQARMYTMIGRLNARRQWNARAIENYRRALALWRTQDASQVGLHQSETLTYLGEALHQTGHETEGNACFHEALAVLPHGATGERVRDRLLADLLTLDPAAKRDELVESNVRLALEAELARPTPNVREIAHRRAQLGSVLLDHGQYDAAAQCFQQAHDELSSMPGGERFAELGDVINSLAIARSGQGRAEEALALAKRAVACQEVNQPNEHKTLGIMLMNLADGEQLSDPKACLQHAQRSVEELTQALSAQHSVTLNSQARLAWYAAKIDELDAADEAACQVLAASAVLDASDPSVGRALMALAAVAEKRGRIDEAEEHWRAAVLALSACPDFWFESAASRMRLGLLRLEAGAIGEAEMLIESAYATAANRRGAPPKQLFSALARLARAQHRDAVAEAYESRANE
jgi:tetratricopeptide (TPR) repeat protein